VNHLPRKLINAYLGWIPNFDIRQLRLSIIRLHPLGGFDERDYLCSWGDQLSRPHLPLSNRAVSRRKDFGVAQVDLSCDKGGSLGVEIRN
jgi:hypothetical protein